MIKDRFGEIEKVMRMAGGEPESVNVRTGEPTRGNAPGTKAIKEAATYIAGGVVAAAPKVAGAAAVVVAAPIAYAAGLAKGAVEGLLVSASKVTNPTNNKNFSKVAGDIQDKVYDDTNKAMDPNNSTYERVAAAIGVAGRQGEGAGFM